jgi:tetratricopeptide (TPR) repeat protein
MIQLALQQYPDNRTIITSIFGYYRDYLDYETCFKLADFLQFARLPVDKWQNKVHAANFFRDYGELERAERLYRHIIGSCYRKIREDQNVNILKKTLDFADLNHAYYLLLINPPQWRDAIQKLQGLLSKNPKHSLYNLYLAKAYTTQAKHQVKSARESKKKAIKYYQKALQYDQLKTGYFWYEFGLFYREMMQDINQAKHCFQQSLEQKINLPTCLELAEIEQQLGNLEQAKTLIEQALSLEMGTRPEQEQKEQLMPRIKRLLPM